MKENWEGARRGWEIHQTAVLSLTPVKQKGK